MSHLPSKLHKNTFSFPLALFCFVLATLPGSAKGKQRLADYTGQWVYKYEGRNLIVLNLKYKDGRLSGVMAMPKHFQMAQGGDISHISSEVGEESVTQASIVGRHLEFITHRNNDENLFSMRMIDHDHASVGLVDIPLRPWTLRRISESGKATVATDWPQQGPKNVTKEIAALQTELKRMCDEDQAARLAKPISDSKIDQIDRKNYPELLHIYQHYGLPHISQVGPDAAGEFWLLVQHQDGHVNFQNQVLQDMKRAADKGEASKTNYAYLYDRVMVNEKKPQHWGTQISCKSGKPVLDRVDNPAGLEQRRQKLQLMPLDKYLEMLAPNCKDPTPDDR